MPEAGSKFSGDFLKLFYGDLNNRTKVRPKTVDAIGFP
jgi:hypothetical protein